MSCPPKDHSWLAKNFQHPIVVARSCMADPELDHSFVYNDQGQVDILKSPFFDINLEIDRTVEEYVDRIVFSFAAAIDEQLSPIQWRIVFKA
ncbi:hypothetical protein M5K25_025013 [Dendrobium thyrsiflorum]|uniref:Uncharacterized protein n=1 Tax=Dendrobium thyrsiflorum TaxID=117978 RepID=A0ABD0U3N4_DENTH